MTLRPVLTSSALLALASAALMTTWIMRGAGGTASATTANVGFSPSTSTISNATPVPVAVSVSDVTGLGGYDAWVSFDGSVVQLNSLKDAGLLYNPNAQGTPQNPVVCITPTITASYGHMACQILAVISPVAVSVGSTPAPLLHASFAPVSGGTSPLELTAVANSTTNTTTLLDLSSVPIAANLNSGSITVNVNAIPSVGGVARSPDVSTLPEQKTTGGSGNRTAFIIGGVLAAVVVLGALAVAWRWRARSAG